MNAGTIADDNNTGTPSGPQMGKIRVLVADDHPLYREGLVAAINSRLDMMVVGEAENGRQLIDRVKELLPDVVLSDVKMPYIDGLRAIREIIAMKLGIRCILISQYDNDFYLADAIAAGAGGYLLKKATRGEIADAVLAVFAYRQYFCRFASEKLAKLIAKSIYNIEPSPQMPLFSDKEKEIISLLCQEKSSGMIGRLLFMSPRTVEGHKEKIMNKIGTKTTVGIVVFAIRHGIYNPEESL